MAHAFWNAGPGPARIQEIISPAGFERYFRDVDEVLAPGGPPDLARLGVIATRYGVTLHMERLDETMRTHGVRLWGARRHGETGSTSLLRAVTGVVMGA